jgi:hypothetical protein
VNYSEIKGREGKGKKMKNPMSLGYWLKLVNGFSLGVDAIDK